MTLEELSSFRLVGGTSLSLMIGHRMSVDIDLFTDSDYGKIDFEAIYKLLVDRYPYVSDGKWLNESVGNSCFIGESKDDAIKLDFYYTDKFVYPIHELAGVRLSSIEEITAMKLELIGRGGRKKDFWDIHALLDYFTIDEMLSFYEKRYPYHEEKELLRPKLIDFKQANLDPDPNCLLGNYWELIKLDIEEKVVE